MTIKQNGGIFGRNPEYNETTTNDLTVSNDATISSDLTVSGKTALGTTTFSDYTLKIRPQSGATIAGEIDGNLGAGNDNTETEIFRFIGASQTNVRNPRLSVFATRSLTAGNRVITLNTYDGGDNARTLKLQSNGAITELGGNLKVPSGSGIDFSATSGTGTSELFDDYEEGTWTPVLSDATSGGNTATLGSSTAHYVKVGSVVHLFLQVININNSGMTGGNTLYIQGLPYTSVSSNNSAGSVVFDRVSVSGFFAVTPAIGPTRDYMTLGTTTTGAADGSLTVAAFNNSSSDIQNLHISYRA